MSNSDSLDYRMREQNSPEEPRKVLEIEGIDLSRQLPPEDLLRWQYETKEFLYQVMDERARERSKRIEELLKKKATQEEILLILGRPYI